MKCEKVYLRVFWIFQSSFLFFWRVRPLYNMPTFTQFFRLSLDRYPWLVRRSIITLLYDFFSKTYTESVLSLYTYRNFARRRFFFECVLTGFFFSKSGWEIFFPMTKNLVRLPFSFSIFFLIISKP